MKRARAEAGDVLELPFDQYQRYRLVADLIERVRPKSRRLSILDVGGRTALLRRFLPEDMIELVDLEPSDAEGLVLGSGSALPLRDQSVDVVCAFDTLEHVPRDQRRAFVSECARVAGRHVILAGPYGAPEVDQAEELLVAFLRDKLGSSHRYLNEHRQHGLPLREEVEAWLAEQGQVLAVGHASLARWLPLMCLELWLDHEPLLRDVARRFYRFYNSLLYASDHAAPVYRHAVVLAKGRARLPRVDDLFPSATAPEGSQEVLLGFAADVLAFDGQKGVLEPELSRLHKVVRSLEKDLAGHVARLSDTGADLAAHKQTLKAERKERAQEQREVEKTIHLLRRDLAEQQEKAAALAADLSGHRAALAEVEVDLAGHKQESSIQREEIAGLRQILAAQETDLAGHRQSLEDLGREKQAIQKDLLAVADEAEQGKAELESLRHRTLALEAERAALKEDTKGHAQVSEELARELGALTRTLELVAEEREDLRAKLEAERHAGADARQRLAAAEATLAEQALVEGELRRELAATQATAMDLGREAEAAREQVEALGHARRDLDLRVADLQGTLDGRALEVRELRGEIEAARRAFEQVAAQAAASSAEAEESRHGRAAAELARSAAEDDLAGHRQALADLGAELEAVRARAAELGREVESGQAEVERLTHALSAETLLREDRERDLLGHRKALEDSARDRAEEQAAQASAIAALTQDLEGHRAVLVELRAEIARLEATIHQDAQARATEVAGLQGELCRRDERIRELVRGVQDLEALLASRKDALKRCLRRGLGRVPVSGSLLQGPDPGNQA